MSIINLNFRGSTDETELNWTQTLLVRNFVHNDPFLTKSVPNERHEAGLSIGTGFVKNGYMLTKLSANKTCKSNRLDRVFETYCFNNLMPRGIFRGGRGSMVNDASA